MLKENLKKNIGITTRTFMQPILNGKITSEKLMKWAAGLGFQWIEIRDNGCEMSKAYLMGLKELGKSLGINLHYAWDGSDLLKTGDEELFKRGIDNAVIFGEGTFSRITIAGSAMKSVQSQRGYLKEDFGSLCKIIKKYNEFASSKKICIVYENSLESVAGDGVTYFGMRELMQTNGDMKMTFDPGNFLNRDQEKKLPTWDQVKEFYIEFKDRIPYIHLKSTKDNILTDNLVMDGDIDIRGLVCMASEKDIICIELPAQDELSVCYNNVEEALKDLLSI